MEGKEVAVRESSEIGIFTPPEVVLENAMAAAKSLMKVVSLKKKPVIMNGEQYLEFDDWQTCGQFYGYTVKTGDAMPVEIDGVKGAKAHADLINFRTGEVVGGAEAYCMRDEEKWNTRPKYEWQGDSENRKRVKIGDEVVPWFQLASMAQTRAAAKAFRNRLAWVVVLAGYKTTPAEEMTEGTVSEAVKQRRTVDKSDHYCELHGVNYFMKGKMKSFAHPILDENGKSTGEWCHEHKEAEKPASKPQPAPQAVTPDSEAVEEQPSPIDLTWLKDCLDKIEKSGVEKWSKKDVLARLNIMVNGEHKKISDAVRQLSPNQAADFASEAQDMVDML